MKADHLDLLGNATIIHIKIFLKLFFHVTKEDHTTDLYIYYGPFKKKICIFFVSHRLFIREWIVKPFEVNTEEAQSTQAVRTPQQESSSSNVKIGLSHSPSER